MKTPSPLIQKFGFDDAMLDGIDRDRFPGMEIARVTAVHKDRYQISNGKNDTFAEIIGKIAYGAASALDFPTVGDWVLAQFDDAPSVSIIHAILPRRSLLKRKSAGKRIAFQLIAANIDTAFIMQSLDGDFNLRRLERYLVMVKNSHIDPVILLSKSDLLPSGRIARRIHQIKEIMPHLPVQPFSNNAADDIRRLKTEMIPGKTYCLLGSSGVGKTTFINRLIGAPVFTTKAVRAGDAKGRHATTTRQLIRLDNGAMLVDTPGMRELGNFAIQSGLTETFAEITDGSKRCRFADCTHTHEKGCAVLDAVRQGELSEKRYRNYIKMNRESRYHEMSYIEKRRRDKKFGKHCKAIMQHKKHHR